jgi:hypothetical protein
MAQQGVPTDSKTQSLRGTRPCLTAQCQRQPAQSLFHAERAAGVGFCGFRQPLRENMPGAILRVAEKAARPHSNTRISTGIPFHGRLANRRS